MFWEIYSLRPPQLRVYRDPCTVKGLVSGHSAVVPAHFSHLFSQPLLCLEHPPLIGGYLYGLSNFLDHLGLCLSLFQLGLQVQNRSLLRGQIQLRGEEKLALVLSLSLSGLKPYQGA